MELAENSRRPIVWIEVLAKNLLPARYVYKRASRATNQPKMSTEVLAMNPLVVWYVHIRLAGSDKTQTPVSRRTGVKNTNVNIYATYGAKS